MKRAMYAIPVVLLVAGAFLAGAWYTRRGAFMPIPLGARQILSLLDPAHAGLHSGTPAVAADSPMPEPARGHGGSVEPGGSSVSMAPGTVTIRPEKQQLVGVRVRRVEKASGTHTLRIFGRVAPDETRVYKLNAAVEGLIQEVSAVTTGSQVEKDQSLATFFTPEFLPATQAYLAALARLDRLNQIGTATPADIVAANGSIQQSISNLLYLGMSRVQIEEIGRTRELTQRIEIRAPANGFVLARNVSIGQKFVAADSRMPEPGRGHGGPAYPGRRSAAMAPAEWYKIADLSRVWILADVLENDAQYLRPGARAQMSLTDQRKTLPARVAEVLQFDAATRTLKVRLEADNPGYVLRPDMFVDVELPITVPPALAVPVDAVLDSGLGNTVFVERGEGVFEPRQVETGWRLGDRVEIVKGLAAGERIVVSGTFLLGSESRMRSAAAASGGTPSNAKAAHAGDERAAHGHGGHHP